MKGGDIALNGKPIWRVTERHLTHQPPDTGERAPP